MDQILAVADHVGVDMVVCDRVGWFGAQGVWHMRQDRGLKLRQRLDWFGQKPIRPCATRLLIRQVAVGPSCAQNNGHAGPCGVHLGDQIKPGPVWQAQIDNRDRRPIDIQMPFRGADTVGATYSRARA